MSKSLYLCAFLFGLIVPVFSEFIPVERTLWLFALSGLTLLLLRLPIVYLLCAFLTGFCITSLHMRYVIAGQMDSADEGKDISAHIEIVSDPVVLGDRARFDAILLGFVSGPPVGAKPEKLLRKKLRLSGYVSTFSQPVERGDVWQMVLRLKRPRGYVNPGGFDYQAWLLYHLYSATGYVKSNTQSILIKKRQHGIISVLRNTLKDRLFSTSTSEFSGFFKALLLGDRSSLSQSQWDILASTGTTHLMAISGLHIGLIAIFAFYLGRLCLSPLKIDNIFILRFLPSLASIVFSGIYAGLSGFAIPAQRAWLMVCFANLALSFGRRTSIFRMLLLVLIAVILVNPFALTQHGFYLSFFAVFILVFSFSNKVQKQNAIRDILYSQWAIFFGLSVILVFRQLPISLVSPLANIVAVPVVSFIVIPFLFLSAFVSFLHNATALFILDLVHYVFSFLWFFLELLSNIDALVQYPFPESSVSFVIAVVGMLFLLSPIALSLRWLGASILLLFFFSDPQKTEGIEIKVLDVGQGLSVITKTRNHTFVYDVGAKFSDTFDIGSRVVAPYLHYRGIDYVDLTVLSHGDNDHSGGFYGYSEKLKLGEVAANHEIVVSDQAFKQQMCIAGQRWKFDGLEVEAIWPHKHLLSELTSNNLSCVLIVQQAGFIALYTGDIEKHVENSLVSAGSLPRDIDVLIAPHHGSNTSSSSPFIAHLNPDLVIFSAGYKNRYGHPSTKVVQRYKALNKILMNTAEEGAISLTIDSNGSVDIAAERKDNRKPWY